MMNYCAVAVGARTYYVANPKEVLEYLPEINPTVLSPFPDFMKSSTRGSKAKSTRRPPCKRSFSNCRMK